MEVYLVVPRTADIRKDKTAEELRAFDQEEDLEEFKTRFQRGWISRSLPLGILILFNFSSISRSIKEDYHV